MTRICISLFRYTWDSKLTDILGPDFRLGDDLRSSRTTLKDILSHRTGLPGMFWPVVAGYRNNVTRADFSK
jgi:hypothetical protein